MVEALQAGASRLGTLANATLGDALEEWKAQLAFLAVTGFVGHSVPCGRVFLRVHPAVSLPVGGIGSTSYDLMENFGWPHAILESDKSSPSFFWSSITNSHWDDIETLCTEKDLDAAAALGLNVSFCDQSFAVYWFAPHRLAA